VQTAANEADRLLANKINALELSYNIFVNYITFNF